MWLSQTVSVRESYRRFPTNGVTPKWYIKVNLDTRWGPPVIRWFINPINYSYLRTINHSYWSYLHQLNAILGAPLCSYKSPKSPMFRASMTTFPTVSSAVFWDSVPCPRWRGSGPAMENYQWCLDNTYIRPIHTSSMVDIIYMDLISI